MLKFVNSLVLAVLLYSPVFCQTDDDFLSDFGGDDFEEIESELDLVTINVAQDVLTDNSVEKKLTNEYFNWDAAFSQKLTYGLESPSVPFFRRAAGIDSVSSSINLAFNSKIAKRANLKLAGDVNWEWGDFQNSKYSVP